MKTAKATLSPILYLALGLALLSNATRSQTLDATVPLERRFSLDYGTTYADARVYHEAFLKTGPGADHRLEALRELFRKGPGGEKLLKNMFGGFEGRYRIDPTIPGLEKTSRMASSSLNSSVAKGNRRALRYALEINADPRFKLISLEQP